MAEPNATNIQYVTIIYPSDVLFGRGSGPNDHEGNIKFRDLVAQRKGEYMATNHRQTKATIAKAIVDTVVNCNGRFLKKLELKEVQRLGFPNTNVDVYTIVDGDTVMEKAKQALRQNREKHYTGSTGSPTSAGVEHNANADDATSAGLLAVGAGLDFGSHSPPQAPPSNANNKPSSVPSQFDIPEPLPQLPKLPARRNLMSHIDTFDQQQKPPMYTEDPDGYATYTTTLGDPEDEEIFQNHRIGGRQASINMMMDVGSSASGSRRGEFTGIGGSSRRGLLLGGRSRDSIGMGMTDVWRQESMLGNRGESMQMSELMGSFKGMSTTTGGEMMNSSSDTIGTIDNMTAYGLSSSISQNMSGISNMSVISMSSTTSLFKAASNGSSDLTMGFREEGGDGDLWPGAAGADASSDHANTESLTLPPQQAMPIPPPCVEEQRQSLIPSDIPSDMWNSRQMAHLLREPIHGSSSLSTLDNTYAGGDPRPVGLMEETPDRMSYLGSSSLSVLRAADQSSESFRVGTTFADSDNNNNNGAAGTQSIFDINQSSDRVLPPEPRK